MRQGGAVVQAVRFASAFFGKGQFSAQKTSRLDGGYRLEQELEGVYYQPFDPPRRVTTTDYDATRRQRRVSEVCRLTQSVEVREKGGRFALTIEARGTERVPLAVEISLRPGGRLEGVAAVAGQEDAWLLTAERAAYRVGPDCLRFGPAVAPAPHRWTQIRGAEPRIAGTSVYLTGVTPFRHELVFEPGA